MNLKNKLKNLPKIYYMNLDNRTDRREYMETQFEYWKISNYERISGTKYLASEYDSWKHLLITDNSNILTIHKANLITHLELFQKFLESDEEYMIMMEDDYDLNLIEYWHFDWEYLMNNIPFDWDCIQIGFESHTFLHFFLHPKLRHTFFGAAMINRHFAKKIVNLYCINNKFKIDHLVADQQFRYYSFSSTATPDYLLHVGRTYCIPLIPLNTNFLSGENYFKTSHYSSQELCRKYYYIWWQKQKDKFTLNDFFTYGKPYDDKMTVDIRVNTFGII